MFAAVERRPEEAVTALGLLLRVHQKARESVAGVALPQTKLPNQRAETNHAGPQRAVTSSPSSWTLTTLRCTAIAHRRNQRFFLPESQPNHTSNRFLSCRTDRRYTLDPQDQKYSPEYTTAAMSPSASIRSALAYAGNLLAQVPLLQDVTNPFSNLLEPVVEGVSQAITTPGNGYSGEVTPYDPLSGAPSCPIDGPMSCHNNTPIAGDDSCCFIYPGGRMLLTQFWDREVHAGGAEQDWTLHGLW